MNDLFHPLPVNEFEVLATHQEPNCISIYIPMYKSGKEQNLGLSQAHLKACIKNVQKSLLLQGMEQNEIDEYLLPVKALLTDMQLWRNPSEGLVVFLNRSSDLQYFLMPIQFEPYAYVSDHHYMVPLMPL